MSLLKPDTQTKMILFVNAVFPMLMSTQIFLTQLVVFDRQLYYWNSNIFEKSEGTQTSSVDKKMLLARRKGQLKLLDFALSNFVLLSVGKMFLKSSF